MIVIIHNHTSVVEVLDDNLKPLLVNIKANETLTSQLFQIATLYKGDLLIWCHQNLKQNLNLKDCASIFHHKAILTTYNPSNTSFLPNEIGFIERSFFLKINKEKRFPTWLMSDYVGGMYANTLLQFKSVISFKDSFNYNLNSIAKLANTQGLFCYSNPKLLTGNYRISEPIIAKKITLYRFVRQHYKWVWVWFLLISEVVFLKKISLLPFIKAWFKTQKSTTVDLSDLQIKSEAKVISNRDIDVIIPTIGRKKYLFDVLQDFKAQTILPKRIIIVEQNPDKTSQSELDFITNNSWPFEIIHKFTHQTGVVNARNVALSFVKSEWTFLGDDDNRFSPTLLEDLFNEIKKYGANVGTTVYLQPNEKQTYLTTSQTSIFGAGNAILKTSLLDKVRFNPVYEFNYGEDNDFGMQLRLQGEDVVYFANIKVTHLKAPIGGYRTKVKQAWENETIKPLPSPTIMFLYKSYFTKQQLLGYKFLYCLRRIKALKPINLISFGKNFKLQWKQSELWSTKLN